MFKLITVPVFFLTAALFAYCFSKDLQTYLKKRNNTSLFLMVLFAGCLVINVLSALDGLLYPDVYPIRYGYAFSLLFTAIAFIGLLFFATEVFYIEETQTPVKKLRIVFAVVLLVISSWGMVGLLQNRIAENLVVLIILFSLNLTIYIVIGIKAYRLAKKIEENVYKKSIKFIGHYAICNIAIYIFFIIDGIDETLAGTTVWGFIGACVFALTAYLAYVGFVKPMSTK